MASAAAAVVGVAAVGIMGARARIADAILEMAARTAARSIRDDQDRVNVDRAANDALGETPAMVEGHFGDDSYGNLSAAMAAPAAA
jgi:hypothetical protein